MYVEKDGLEDICNCSMRMLCGYLGLWLSLFSGKTIVEKRALGGSPENDSL